MVVARVRGSETHSPLYPWSGAGSRHLQTSQTRPVPEPSLETPLGTGQTQGEGVARRRLQASVQQRPGGETPEGRSRPTLHLDTLGIMQPEVLGPRAGCVHSYRGWALGSAAWTETPPPASLLWKSWGTSPCVSMWKIGQLEHLPRRVRETVHGQSPGGSVSISCCLSLIITVLATNLFVMFGLTGQPQPTDS